MIPLPRYARRLAALSAAGLTALVLLAPGAQATPALAAVTMPASVRAALLSAEDDATVAVAVLDTDTGEYYGSTEDQTQFPAESVVKVLIAANLLATGQMTATTEQLAYQMITQSDDDDADSLWGVVGGPDVFNWAQSRYHISDLGSPPIESGWWGNTKFTARGLVELYADLKADPVVGPWLFTTMSQMSASAADGTDQDFGLAAQTADGAFKQGWGGDDDADNSEQLNSTGLLDDNRYAVAILVQHVPYEPMSTLLPTIDAVAAAVAPSGQVAIPPVPPAIPPSPPAPSTTAPSTTAPSTTASTVAPASQPSAGPTLAGNGSARVLAGRSTKVRVLLDHRTQALVFTAAAIAIAGALAAGLRRHRRRQARVG